MTGDDLTASTVEELIASAENAPEGRVCDRLAAIRQDASADGVTVTVDLHGKLVGLDLSRSALANGAADVARRVSGLVAEAAAAAAEQGMAVLAELPGVAESPLLNEIRPPSAPTPPTAEPDDNAVPVLHEVW